MHTHSEHTNTETDVKIQRHTHCKDEVYLITQLPTLTLSVENPNLITAHEDKIHNNNCGRLLAKFKRYVKAYAK